MVLRWLCDSPRTWCAWRITPLCMWREQAIIEWSRRVISIVACCHGAKLCAHAARDFRSQHCVYLPDSEPESKICEKCLFSGSAGVWVSFFYACNFLSENIAEFRLHRWWTESEQESDSQIWKLFRPGFKHFGTGAESESEKVTTAAFAFQKSPQFKIA